MNPKRITEIRKILIITYYQNLFYLRDNYLLCIYEINVKTGQSENPVGVLCR